MDIPASLKAIGLALHSNHNTIATDEVNAQPVADYSWRIDHSKEIVLLEELERFLATRNGNCPLCGHGKKCL